MQLREQLERVSVAGRGLVGLLSDGDVELGHFPRYAALSRRHGFQKSV